MTTKTSIEWTDATWNPTRGCTRYSPGCHNCYAEIMAARFSQPGSWGHGFAHMRQGDHRWTGNVELVPKLLDLPLRWRAPRKIFVNSTSDLFHEGLPDEAIDRVFATMALAPRHTFQVLTKRADRMKRYSDEFPIGRLLMTRVENHPSGKSGPLCEFVETISWPLPHVWLGVSVEDQQRADERIPALLDTPAAVRFLSCEPLLGEVDITEWLWPIEPCPNCPCPDPLRDRSRIEECCRDPSLGDTKIGWVICGGESGSKARPMHPDWARGLRDQCAAAQVPFFFKQWGEHMPLIDWQRQPPGDDEATFSAMPPERITIVASRDDGMTDTRAMQMARVGKIVAGRLLDGRKHSEFPL